MSRNFSWPLLLAALIYLCLAAALALRVPPGAAPDEHAHWEYVEHLATTRALPVFKGQVPPVPGYEFHQPPLYYLLCAPLWAVLPAGIENYACRFVAVFCGLGTLVLVWKTARRLFPDARRIAGGAVLLAALSPLHLGLNASSNNDSLGGFLCAALFYLVARAWTEPVSWRLILGFGCVAAAGLWTKNTCLVAAAAAFLGLVGALIIGPYNSKTPTFTRGLAVAVGLVIVLVAPLWIRNQTLYGDPLGLRLFSQAATAGTPGFPQFSQAGMDFVTYARGMAWQILLSAWGFYGGPTTISTLTAPLSRSGPRLPDAFLALPLLVCALLPLAAYLGWRRLPPWDEKRRKVVQIWLVGALLVFLAWAQFAYAHFSGGQARYLYPAFLPLCVLAAAGWAGFWRGRAFWLASGVAGALMLGLTFLNLLVWRTLV